MQLVLLFGVLPAIVTMRVAAVRRGPVLAHQGLGHPPDRGRRLRLAGSDRGGRSRSAPGVRSACRRFRRLPDRSTSRRSSIPLLGEPAELSEVLVASRARALIVAHGGITDAELVDLVRTCHRQHCEVFVLPRLYEMTHVADDMDVIGDLPLIRLRRAAYRSPSWRLKRVMDIAVSAPGDRAALAAAGR